MRATRSRSHRHLVSIPFISATILIFATATNAFQIGGGCIPNRLTRPALMRATLRKGSSARILTSLQMLGDAERQPGFKEDGTVQEDRGKVERFTSRRGSRRDALGGGVTAVMSGLLIPSMWSQGEATAELTPFMEETLRGTGVFPGMRGTEINGKMVDSDCQGSRGNRCNVWTPPEVEESPSAEQAAGKRGEVTSKVFFDVRIITDYTNEVLEDASKRGRIVVGLYGKDSPKTVAEFLKFVRSDDSYPSYNSGMFFKHQAGKWIEGGRINGLTLEDFGGSQVYQYLSKIINLKPILEVNELQHSRKLLLTHQKLNPGPEFGITTAPAPELDGGWTVFGEVLEGSDLVTSIASLPFVTGKSLDPDGTLADSWWKAQNKYFLGLAKQFGDSRAGKMYPGKLLRRVEIVKCGEA